MENGELVEDVLGLATVTVGATGKISGKFYEGGTNWVLSAASYTAATSAAAPAQSGETPLPPGGAQSGETPLPPGGVTSAAAPAGFVCTNVVAKYAYKAKEKVKGKWKTVTKYVERTFNISVSPVPVVPDVPIRGIATLVETGGAQPSATEITAYQNLWGSTYKAVGKALFTTKSGKKTLAYKNFTVDVYTNAVGEVTFIKKSVDDVDTTGLTCFATLSLKVTTAGAVTATLTYDTGKTKKDPKTKKTVKVYYKPTCATVVIPTSTADADPFTGVVPLFFAPSAGNNFPGWNGDVPF